MYFAIPAATGSTTGDSVGLPDRTRKIDVRWFVRFAVFELAIWASVYGGYLVLRGASIGQPDEAMEHAEAIVGVEQTLGLFHEAQVQDWFDGMAGFLSAYYLVGFGPLVVVTAGWLLLRWPGHYLELRTVLLVSIAIASVVYLAYPVAPPRLVGGLGIADTVGLSDHDAGSFAGVRFNPYAAMPSMHVGWSLLVGVYGLRAARLPVVRTFFLVHPVVMALAVTVTGNHYLLDSVAGAAVAGLSLILVRRGNRRGLGLTQVLTQRHETSNRPEVPCHDDRDHTAFLPGDAPGEADPAPAHGGGISRLHRRLYRQRGPARHSR